MRNLRVYLIANPALLILMLWSWPQVEASAGTALPGESIIFARSGGVFLASISDEGVQIKQIIPPERQRVWVTVSEDQQTIWISKKNGEISESDLPDVGAEIQILESTKDFPAITNTALSPDGNEVCYIAKNESALALVIRNMKDGDERILTSGWEFLMAPSWSPDGKSIAFFCSQEAKARAHGGVSLRLIDVVSGREKELAGPSKVTRPYGGEERYPAIWSSNGERIVFEASYGDDKLGPSVYTVDPNDEGKPTKVSYGVVASVSRQDDTIYIVDSGAYAVVLRDTQWRRQLVVKHPAYFPKISPSGKAIAYTKPRGLYCRILGKEEELVIADDSHFGFGRYHWVKTTKTNDETPADEKEQ